MRDRDLNELTGLIYEAVWDPTSVAGLLERMKEGFRACNATLGISSSDFRVVARYHSLTPPAFSAGYAEVIQDDPWARAIIGQSRAGAFLGTDLVNQKDYRRSEIYQQFNKPCDIEYLGIAANAQDPQMRSWLTVNRTKRQGDFSSDDRSALGQLYIHLKKAAALYWVRAQPADVSIRAKGQHLEIVNGDIDGLLDRLPSLRVDAWGIRSTDRVLDEQMQKSLARSLRSGSVAELRIPLTHDQACLIVRVVPPPTQGRSNETQTTFSIEPTSFSQRLQDVIADAYCLTRAESAIVSALCQGQSVADIARDRSTTDGAVRFHLKNIFQKLHVQRQSELVTLVLNGPVGSILRADRAP